MGWFDAANTWLSLELSTSSGVTSFLLLLAAGAMASLLPCVYPLYPITAAILARREDSQSRIAAPLVYYAGLGAVYFAFGIVASLTGGSFNGVLRLPITNLSIGGLLFLLALATAGLLHFPTFSRAPGAHGTGLRSVFVMGAGAGILSSACVGPVVVSILISIAAATTQLSLGAALLAAAKMMLFGLGVGFPLLLIGVFGVALPKGGLWMVRVQQAFALLIGWFALGYLKKGLAGAGFDEAGSSALLVGVALVFGAIFFTHGPDTRIEERTKRSALGVLGVVGFFVVGRATLATVPASAAPVAHSAPVTETHGNLTWHLDKESAYSLASQTGRPVFVDFHGDWCTNCKAFQERTLADTQLNGALSRAVLLKVRDTTALFEEYRRDPRFPELKVGLPFFLITDEKGQLLYKTNDYTKSEEMALFLPEPNL